MNTHMVDKKFSRDFMLYFLSNISDFGSEILRKLDQTIDPLYDILKIDKADLMTCLNLTELKADRILQQKERINDLVYSFENLEQMDIHFITIHDEEYPDRLRRINQSPMVLYYKGRLPDPESPTVGIVGSRASSAYGNKVAMTFARALADNGVQVISGLALGIDGAAHRGALDTIQGRTYGIVAGGVDIIYPKENKDVYNSMIKGRGGVISETSPGIQPLSRNFPMRNRLISGLSDVILVVEAKAKSGSLITADYALNQNKTLMAVPGRIWDPMSIGTNTLIMAGAKLVNSPQDILEELEIKVKNERLNDNCNENVLDNEEKIVYSTLDLIPKHIDEICSSLGLDRSKTLSILVSLELKGMINRVSSNYYGRD